MQFAKLFVSFGILLIVSMPDTKFAEPNVPEIVRQSVEKNQQNRKVAPQYSYTEHDVTVTPGGRKDRAYWVVMIDGSPYNELIGENGEPLSPERQAAEEKKLADEDARRKRESPSARQKRIADYEKDRRQEDTLMQEMVKAFDFHLNRNETVNGRECYVLDATPQHGYQPASNETKVLTGMRGKLWIDRQENQWVKVEAEVFRPVAFGLFFAHVQPGTEIILEQTPVGNGVWLPARVLTRVRATAFGFWSKNYTKDETYSGYHLGKSETE